MDVTYFLRDRITFIRQFFDTASFPFLEIKRKIEAEEEPFVPPYSEDGEPPFLAEWGEADDSQHVLGCFCISMLDAALRVYLKTWVAELRVPVGDSFKTEFSNGWINGYRAYFSTKFGIHFDSSPADLSLLEEIALARNRTQHLDHIAQHRPNYSASDLKKLPRAFFISETERALLSDTEAAQVVWFLPPNVHITREKLLVAIGEAEKFAVWFEEQIRARRLG